MVESITESSFLYDIALGFMPRKFEPTQEDSLIYDEEDSVPEMYFVTEGIIGVGYCLADKGLREDNVSIGKKLVHPVLICDHYVMNDLKSQFIY